MRAVLLIEDVVALLAFASAGLVLMTIPVGTGSRYSRGAKAFSVAACLVFLLVNISDVLDWFGVASVLDDIEDVALLLTAPFLLFAVYSLYARQQLNDSQASRQRAVEMSEMTRRIVETTPAGIIMLDEDGNLVFSNEMAKHLLDLDYDPETGITGTPGWTMRVIEQGGAAVRQSDDFAALLSRQPLSDAHMVVEWPTGWRRRLAVNTAPAVRDGEVSGTVAAFVEREPWLSRTR